MKRKKVWMKALIAGAAAGLVLYTGVRAFQKEDTFHPDTTRKEIQENHVVFQDKNKKKTDLDDSTGDSDLWEKDKQEQRLKMNQIPDSSVLFEKNGNAEQSKDNKYMQDQKGKKMPVKLSQENDKNSHGVIRINRDDPSGDTKGDDSSGNNGKKPSGNDGDNGNGNGDQPGTQPGTDPAASPSGGDQNNDSKDPGDTTRTTTAPSSRPTETPRPTVTPVVTEKPTPPETTPTPPKGDSLIEGLYPNIQDYPTDGMDENIQKLHLMIMPIFNMDRTEYIYYNAELTKEKLLYSVLVYVADENNKVYYRLTEFNDNFQIGAFPEVAEEDFTVNFLFRQNASAQWQTTSYDFTVLPYKYFIVDQDGLLAEENEPDDGAINLLSYYTCNFAESDRNNLDTGSEYALDSIIPGWIDTVEGTMVSDQYQMEEKGWKAFEPAQKQSVPAGYEAKLKWYFDVDNFDYYANLKFLQTLTKIPEGTKDLEVMQGIHWVDLTDTTVKTITLADSTAVVGAGLTVEEAYKVSENNPYFLVQDGVLYNKEQTRIEGVPLSCRELDLSDKITYVQLPSGNSIQKLTLTSEEPPEMQVENLKDAIVWVPKDAYETYYAAWGSRLADSVQLMSDEADSTELVMKDGAILSKDGSVLYRLTNEVKGSYVVPESVRVIKENALKACKELYQIVVTTQVEDLEENSLVCDSLEKVVLLEEEVPLHAKGGFVNSSVKVLMTQKLYQQWESKQRTASMEAAVLSLKKEDGYILLSQDGTGILMQTPADIKEFRKVAVDGQNIDQLAPGAFRLCKDMMIAVLAEPVKYLEKQAFTGCDGLQGVLCQSKDTITVEKDAFGDCSHIRFLAYNALKGIFKDGYCPMARAFRVGGATGYPMSSVVPYMTYELAHASEFFLEGTVEDGIYLYADYKQEGVIDGTYLVGTTDNISGELPLREDTAEIIFYAFQKCRQKFTIDFTKYPQLFSIGEHAFEGSGLAGDITLPEGLFYLSIYAFQACTNITTVKLECDYLTVMPIYAFSGCTSLTSVTLNADSQLEKIESYAFSETALESFTIPENVTEIYEYVFAKCYSLHELYVTGSEPAKLKVADDHNEFTFGKELPADFEIAVPGKYVSIYKKEWELYADKIIAEQLAHRR